MNCDGDYQKGCKFCLVLIVLKIFCSIIMSQDLPLIHLLKTIFLLLHLGLPNHLAEDTLWLIALEGRETLSPSVFSLCDLASITLGILIIVSRVTKESRCTSILSDEKILQ